MEIEDGDQCRDCISAHTATENLPFTEHVFPENTQAGTVTIAGQDYGLVVLLDILHGERKELAALLGVSRPLFRQNWQTYSVRATTALGFFEDGHLWICHAEVVPIVRPWKHLAAHGPGTRKIPPPPLSP